MIRVPTRFTVADYCAAMDRNEIIVNKNYQRSDRVWPDNARSFLIETVIKGFPVPKFYLFQKTDLKTKQTIKEIVDGQQRSAAIRAFFNDEFVLAKKIQDNPDIQGKKYSELDEEYQQAFLDYSIDADLFTGSNTKEVVEVFRRMNSYTAPLNPEEQRHAEYQGTFKWFINDTAKVLNSIVLNSGIFTEKQLVRMADNKLLTEVCDALDNGIRTTSKVILDAIYRRYDVKFPHKDDYSNRILEAFDELNEFDELIDTSIMKPFMVYSLVLAITHRKKNVSKFESVYKFHKKKLPNSKIVRNLEALATAFDEDDRDGKLGPFVVAASEKTNTADTRKVRFKWFCRALCEDLTS